MGLPIRWSVARHWREIEPSFVPDIDLPKCFACGYDQGSQLAETDNSRTIRLRWENANFLESAHIIAASISGPARVNNLLLLCKRCHVESPMLDRRDLMLQWVRDRPYILEYWAKELAAIVGEVPASTNPAGVVPFLGYLKADRHPGLLPGSMPSSYLLAAREYVALHRAGFVYKDPPR